MTPTPFSTTHALDPLRSAPPAPHQGIDRGRRGAARRGLTQGDFASPAAYEAAVDTLREAWSEQGLTVEGIPAPGTGEPGAGLAGNPNDHDRDIELSLRPDRYSGKPTLLTDAGCIRHEAYLVRWE
ncbi:MULTISPECIES: hypothetical protein [unclassified Streptomyces]|uniref:hypothetical protein n=1 Tax=unclassified Streptomyces TaxID=2593676 RepID=UPI0034273C5D